MEKTKHFVVVAYRNDYDFKFKKNGEVFTDIESLLKYLNRATYYDARRCVEVDPHQPWDVRFNECYESYENKVAHWVVEEKPTDTSIRIVGVDMLLAKPQKSGVVVFDDLNDPRLADVPQERMALYPYTMGEFLNLLANPNVRRAYGREIIETIPYKDYNFIALLKN